MNTISNSEVINASNNMSKVNTTIARLSSAPSGSTKTSEEESQVTRMSRSQQDNIMYREKRGFGFFGGIVRLLKDVVQIAAEIAGIIYGSSLIKLDSSVADIATRPVLVCLVLGTHFLDWFFNRDVN